MVPNGLALLTNLLLASVAVPSRLKASLARRRQNRQSQPLKDADGPSGSTASNVEPYYVPSWVGVVISEAPGTFTTVTGTFAIPTVSGVSGSAISIWVGIDGDTCQNAILQTGVDITVGGGYAAWYEWYPDYAYDFSGISINAGDVIRATLNVSTTTSGLATIENLTNGQTVSQELTSSYALCEQDVGWVLEGLGENGGQIPLPDFGTVVVTNATADGTYTPSSPGASVMEMQGVTSVTGSTIIFQYV